MSLKFRSKVSTSSLIENIDVLIKEPVTKNVHKKQDFFWTKTQKNLNSEKYGPRKTQTLENLKFRKPGTWKTYTLENINPANTCSKKNLDLEKP